MNQQERRKSRVASTAGNAGQVLTHMAREYVQAHSEEKFSLQAIADALFVNGSYLLRVFKANTGHTLLWYHNHTRCENAKRLLLSDRSISQVGEARITAARTRPLLVGGERARYVPESEEGL